MTRTNGGLPPHPGHSSYGVISPSAGTDPSIGRYSRYSDDPLGTQIDFRFIAGHPLIAFIRPRALRAQLLDFDTGKRAVVFERALGLAALRFEDVPGQPVALVIDAGFGRKRIDDIAAWFTAQP